MQFLKTVTYIVLLAVLLFISFTYGVNSGQEVACKEMGGIYYSNACFKFEEFIPCKT